MSYQVLARKWRPNIFSEVVGQEHILTILSNALSLGRVHHAYLFSGTRGVGKTSIARILAKGLNCESGITATPCGVCDNCRDIEQGRFVDLLEIDAASRTKVEDTREILDNIQYLPTKGRFKVYLIDEVHMLSRSSFNALLKTLEEPPEHVKFLLATTDPQKLPITILSRCLHLHLNVLDSPLIGRQLEKILQLEHITSSPKAISLLAKAANGSMRDALSLTDQAIALGNGQIDENSVAIMLGVLDKNIPFLLIEALQKADGNALMQQLDLAAKQGANWDTLLAESIALLHQIALLQVVPTALGDYSDNEERIRFLVQYLSPNDVQLFYQILLMGRRDLIFSPDKKMGVEMSFLRALAFMPQSETEIVQPATPTSGSIGATATQIKTPISVKSKETIISTASLSQHKSPSFIPHSNDDNKQEKKVSTNNIAAFAEQSTMLPITEKIQQQPSSQLDSFENQQANVTTPTDEEMSSTTKSILEMRMKLMQGEQNEKKSEAVERVQPTNKVTSLPLAKFKAQLIKKEVNVNQTAAPDTGQVGSLSESDDDSDEELITAENYQWQATHIIETKNLLQTNTKSLFQTEPNQKTLEMEQLLFEEVSQKDSWTYEIKQLTIPPLIKQLAMNSFTEPLSDDIIALHVRSEMKHLIKTSNNINKLTDALSVYHNRNLALQVIIDDDKKNNTPSELMEILYQQKLGYVTNQIKQDDKVAMICQFFEAQIDEESIRPV